VELGAHRRGCRLVARRRRRRRGFDPRHARRRRGCGGAAAPARLAAMRFMIPMVSICSRTKLSSPRISTVNAGEL